MDNTEKVLKWVYSFLMLLLFLAWGVFNVWIVYRAAIDKNTVDILGAAGASAITGAMISWNGQIVTHWFRKKGPAGSAPGSTPAGPMAP